LAGANSSKSPSAVPAAPPRGSIGPDQVIRLGFVGVGGRGGGLLKSALMQEKISVKAVADLNDENRNRAVAGIKEKLGETPEVYTGENDYEKVLARDDIDAVVIAVPCSLHARMYLACFAAGKHFYGEKPMCIDARSADALVAAQKKNPRVVAQIGFQRRASQRYQEGIRRIREGAIGKPISARAAWNNAWGPLGGKGAPGTRFWFGRREFSGDWMLEQACHSWDVLCWITGEIPVSASGMGRRDIFTDIDPGRDVTDFYLANVAFPSGLLLDFEHNWFCPNKDDGRFTGVFERVAGPKGGIDLTDGKIFPRDKNGKVVQLRGPSADPTVLAIEAFLKSIRTQTPPVSGVVNGRMATLTGLLVRKAVDERRNVSMSEIL